MADFHRFHRLPEFEKELKRLSKKYPSLPDDIEDIKPILSASPTGIGKNFIIIRSVENEKIKVKVVKADIHCESLRKRSIRLIYAYHSDHSGSSDKIEFMYIELYFKGDKENEDRERIEGYLKNIATTNLIL